MFTLNTILKEISNLSDESLGKVHSLICELNAAKKNKKSSARKKIMSYAGSFSDMKKSDFADMKKYTKKVRADLFTRNA